MGRLFYAATAAAALCSHVAIAQTSPGFQDNTVFYSNTLNAAIAGKADMNGGTLTNPGVTNPSVTGGTFSGGDVSAQRVMPTGGTHMRTPADLAADFPTPAGQLAAGQTEAALRGGTMDAAPAIQATWAKGSARLPCGSYRLDGPITAPGTNTALLGESEGCVRLLVNFPTGDVITVPSTVGNVHIAGFQMLTSVARTSGAAIRVTGAGSTTLRDIKMERTGTGSWFDGILVGGGAIVTRMSGLYLANATNDCIRVENRSVDIYIHDANTAACNVGLRLRSASGVYLHDLDLVGSGSIGFLIDPAVANGDSVDAVMGDTVLSDTSGGTGIALVGTGRITEINIVNLWASNSGTSGVFTVQQVLNVPATGLVIDNELVNGVTLTAPRFKGNGAHGVQIIHGTNIIMTGAQSLMNSAAYGTVPPGGGPAGTTRHNGFQIEGQVTNVLLMAPIGGPGGWELGAGLPIKQGYGLVRTLTGTGGQVVTVIGGQFNGNVTGPYLLPAATGDRIVDLGNQ